MGLLIFAIHEIFFCNLPHSAYLYKWKNYVRWIHSPRSAAYQFAPISEFPNEKLRKTNVGVCPEKNLDSSFHCEDTHKNETEGFFYTNTVLLVYFFIVLYLYHLNLGNKHVKFNFMKLFRSRLYYKTNWIFW